MNSFIIIEYIKTSIDILVDIKVKNQIEAFFNNFHNKVEGSNAEAYEELLRKSESDIRNHIKIEHQMKIYSDNLKAKIEELEKSKADYKKNYMALQDVNFFHFVISNFIFVYMLSLINRLIYLFVCLMIKSFILNSFSSIISFSSSNYFINCALLHYLFIFLFFVFFYLFRNSIN